MAKRPYTTVSTRNTPVTEQIPGTVPNSTGGFSFGVDDWTRLRRFLVLGSEGGSYYASEQKLTKENADALFRCIKVDGRRTVDEIVAISVAGRNPKQAPVLFAFAACAGAEDTEVRRYALSKLNDVCRTGSHLLEFASYIEQFRGWGRGLRNAIANWYLAPEDGRDVALQVAKYQNRYGWTHRDLLALFVKRDFIAQYKQTILGPLWHVIQPVFTTVMFLLVFGKIANIPTDGIRSVLFYMSGITI
jgi:60 kDa SS-A/Ro ribonucleoprotein